MTDHRQPSRTTSSAPYGALLQVNRFCNLRCSHCSQAAPLVSASANLRELSTDAWKRVLVKLAQCAVPRVRFTGGEPFLRPDLAELSCAARTLGLEVSYVTNGLLLLRRTVEWLQDIEPTAIWISIYGYPAHVYEHVSGIPGSFERVLRSVEALVRKRLHLGMYFPVGTDNHAQVREFIRYAHSAGVRSLKLMQVLPHGRAVEAGALSTPSAAVLERTLDLVLEAMEHCQGMSVKFSLRSGQARLFQARGFTIPPDLRCSVGTQHVWTVDSLGKVLPCCLFLNKSAPELFDLSVGDVPAWQSWDRRRSLQVLQVSARGMRSCPAVGDADKPKARRADEFICPLSYAELEA